MAATGTYRQRLGVHAVLNHGDADGEGAAVEVAVLLVVPAVSRTIPCHLSLLLSLWCCCVGPPTDQDGGNLVQNVDCLLRSSLLLGPLVGWHLGRTDAFCARLWLEVEGGWLKPRDARWTFNYFIGGV